MNTPTRFAVSDDAERIFDRIKRGQQSRVPEAPVDGLTVHEAAWSWPDLFGTTREFADGDHVATLIRQSWDEGIITGPSAPIVHIADDEDGYTVTYAVERGTMPGRVRLTTRFMDVTSTADADARSEAWAVSVLEHVAMHLNAILTEHDLYVASLRTAA